MRVFLERSFNGIYKFLSNPLERKFTYLALVYGNKRRFQPKQIKFLGFKFLVPDCLSFIWQFKEIFVEEYYRFESASETPLILDCGANIGTSCVYFKRLYPKARIIAFEANPKIAEILKENLRTNNFKDIEVIDKAVWINEQGVEMGIEDADASSIYKENNKVRVGSIRLKDFLDKYDQIDMLKIDIEGAELEVLKDCRKSVSNVKNLFVEFHSFTKEKQTLSEIINILEENNFRYYIRSVEDRAKPLVNKKNKSNPEMDLQLNIFAYRLN